MKPFAVFDFDGTCINGDASETTLLYAQSKGFLSSQKVEEYFDLVERDYRAGSILCVALIETLSEDLITAALRESMLKVRPEILDFMEMLSDCDQWIISASSTKVLEVALPHFGFSFPFIGISLGSEPYTIDEGKVECIKTHIHPSQRPIFAAGDSVHDFPMFEYAKSAYLVL